MSGGSRLDRSMAYLVDRWQEWLPLLRVDLDPGVERECTVCPDYAALLELDEYVHAALHELIADALGIVDVLTVQYAREHLPMLSEDTGSGSSETDLGTAAPDDAAEQVRRFHRETLHRMRANLRRRRVTIGTAMRLYVEPKVAAMLPDEWRE